MVGILGAANLRTFENFSTTLYKNVYEKSKIKVARNCWGKVRKVRNVSPDFLRSFRNKIQRYIATICIAVVSEMKQSAAFWLRSRDRSEMNKNAPENPKSKVARNCRRKVQRAPQSLNRLLRSFQTDFGQYLVGIGNISGVENQAICCILVDFIFRFQLKYS